MKGRDFAVGQEPKCDWRLREGLSKIQDLCDRSVGDE